MIKMPFCWCGKVCRSIIKRFNFRHVIVVDVQAFSIWCVGSARNGAITEFTVSENMCSFFRVIFNYPLSKNKDDTTNQLHQLLWRSRFYLHTIDSRFIEVTQLTQLSHIILSFLALSPSYWKWKLDPCPNNRTHNWHR